MLPIRIPSTRNGILGHFLQFMGIRATERNDVFLKVERRQSISSKVQIS